MLKEMLSPRTGGKTARTSSFSTARENFDMGAAGRGTKAASATDWLKKARQGDPNAWSWTVGGTYKGKKIIDAKVMEDGNVKVILGELKANGELREDVSFTPEFINPKTGTKEQLLRLYSAGRKSSETEFNSVEDFKLEEIMSPGLDLNSIMNE